MAELGASIAILLSSTTIISSFISSVARAPSLVELELHWLGAELRLDGDQLASNSSAAGVSTATDQPPTRSVVPARLKPPSGAATTVAIVVRP